MDIKVSVIVPMYNVEKYLCQCLDSLICQTLREIEIICVDDGSPDQCADIVEEYRLHDNRIKLIRQENMGLSAARNAGVAAAGGEYLYFIDSDDWLDADALTECYNAAHEYNSDVVFFDAVSYNEIGPVGEMITSYDRRRQMGFCAYKSIRADMMFELMLGTGGYLPAVVLNFISMSLYKECNMSFKVGLIHEDELFTPQLYAYAQKMIYIPESFYHRRVRSGSIMTTVTKQTTIRSIKYIISELLEYAHTLNKRRQELIEWRCVQLFNYLKDIEGRDFMDSELYISLKAKNDRKSLLRRLRKWYLIHIYTRYMVS